MMTLSQAGERNSHIVKRNVVVSNGTTKCMSFHGSSSGFPDVNDIRRDKRNASYSVKTQDQAQDNRQMLALDINVKAKDLHQEKSQSHSEHLGLRRRHGARARNISSTVSIPKDAKFMPTPPGVNKPRQLPPIVKPTPGTSNVLDVKSCGDVPELRVERCKRQNEKPKSLLDEIKQTVSYDNRVMPSMELRKTLPPPSPNSIVFSLRNNDEYTHQDILDLISHETGMRALSVQLDPVQIRSGNRDVGNRWIVKLGTPADALSVTYNGFKINGERIIVRLLDSVMKMEVQAYKLKIAEEAKIQERAVIFQAQSKNAKRKRVSVKKAIVAKL